MLAVSWTAGPQHVLRNGAPSPATSQKTCQVGSSKALYGGLQKTMDPRALSLTQTRTPLTLTKVLVAETSLLLFVFVVNKGFYPGPLD